MPKKKNNKKGNSIKKEKVIKEKVTKEKATKEKVTKKEDLLLENLTIEDDTHLIKAFFIEFRENPKKAMISVGEFFKYFFQRNKFFFLFIFLNVLNGFLIRLLTANENNNAFNLDALLADFSFVLMLGSLGFLFEKRKVGYWKYVTLALTAICVINSIYYTYYTSFTSITLLSLLKYTTSIGNAIVENVVQIKDFVYVLPFIIFIVVKRRYDKMGYFKKYNYYKRGKKKTLWFFLIGLLSFGIFLSTCTSTDFGRLDKQWNREYIVMKYGIYVYHVNDLIKSVEPKLVSIFGYDSALKNFNEYYENNNKYKGTNEYTNMLANKNVIVIHGESIQNFVIGLTFNGQEVTPNLNKLASKGLYFDNFYTQVSVGTSSDTEFTFNTSLMPANYGTAFSNYFDKEYVSTPQRLRDKGYYTFSMHGNNGDFWNRRIMHANLGYDTLYAKNTYEIDEVVGLGISDVSFFRQSVEKIKTINEEHEKYFGYVITLSNHTPFSDTDKYGEFDVDIKEGDTVYPYMEGTKLGRYLKSVHYADYALGLFFDELEKEGLLENTAIVFFGDHDARLPQEDFNRLYNYDKTTNDVLPSTDPNYKVVNDYTYEIDRKTPLIIWSKSTENKAKKVSYFMGMYDVMPTLGNMMGFDNKYALGHDIFNIKDNNIIVFPTSNWLTKDMYYNAQKAEGYAISTGIIGDDYIANNSKYAEDLLKVSNDILIYDLIRNSNAEASKINENKIVEGASQ